MSETKKKGLWISGTVLQDKSFLPNEKFILSIIYNITKNGTNQFYGKNAVIAMKLGVSRDWVYRMMKKLVDLGYIIDSRSDKLGVAITPEFIDRIKNNKDNLWIAEAVLLDEKLTPHQKLVLATIIKIYNYRGVCQASNAYIAKGVGLKKTSITKIIRKLADVGYITTDVKRSQDVAECWITERKLTPFGQLNFDKCYEGTEFVKEFLN